MAKIDEWYKLRPYDWASEFSKIKDSIARGVAIQLAIICLTKGALPIDLDELSRLSDIEVELLERVQPYLKWHCSFDNDVFVFNIANGMFKERGIYPNAKQERRRSDLLNQAWKTIRNFILERDQRICAYCGNQADTVDHIVPYTQGGGAEKENLVTSCRSCNARKSDRTPEEAGMKILYMEGVRV